MSTGTGLHVSLGSLYAVACIRAYLERMKPRPTTAKVQSTLRKDAWV